MDNKILKIVYKEVGKKPRILEIEDTLEKFQELVGGYIETINYRNLVLVCNEEGKLLELKPNINLGYDYIVGNLAIVGDDKMGNFKSLTDDEIELVINDLEKRKIEEEEDFYEI